MTTTTLPILHTIRENEITAITLALFPSRAWLITEYIEPGFVEAWRYKTPFVYDPDKKRWEVLYRAGEENIPKLSRAERKQCNQIISEFDDSLPF